MHPEVVTHGKLKDRERAQHVLPFWDVSARVI